MTNKETALTPRTSRAFVNGEWVEVNDADWVTKKEQEQKNEQQKFADIQEEQQKQVGEFQANMPKMQDDAFGMLAQNERRNLAEQMTGINRSANSRGLLYSGINQGAQAGAKAQSRVNLAQGRQDINRSFKDQLDEMRTQAISTGVGAQQNRQAASDLAYQRALASMSERRGMLGSLGGAIGMGAGMYLAGGNPAGGMIGSKFGSSAGGGF